MAGEPPPAQRSKLTELTISQRELALQRFQILRPFLEDGVPLTRVAQAKGLKLRTAQGWVTRYRRQGLIGLLHQGRAD